MTRALLTAAFATFGVAAAADPATTPTSAPVTVMLAPGKVLLDDPLNAPLATEWKSAKGKWEATDGAVRGAEIPADMHGAVTRRPVAMTDAVVVFSFKLDGTKAISLSLNGAKGHISRVRITPAGVSVHKDDQDGKNGPDKGQVLDTAKVAVKPGEWHTLVVELRGPDILATLDGKHTAFGTHEAIDKPKANLGLTVAGSSASFKGLTVREATGPAKDWDATRAKLVAARKK